MSLYVVVIEIHFLYGINFLTTNCKNLISQESREEQKSAFKRELSLKGKAQYSSSPSTNLFRTPAFFIENIIYLFIKTSQLNEEVTGTEPSPSVSIPWIYKFSGWKPTHLTSVNIRIRTPFFIASWYYTNG